MHKYAIEVGAFRYEYVTVEVDAATLEEAYDKALVSASLDNSWQTYDGPHDSFVEAIGLNNELDPDKNPQHVPRGFDIRTRFLKIWKN